MAFGIPPSEGGPRLSYGSYLQVDRLRGLQTLQSDPPQHDEMLFIIIHQVFELWFKQLLHELDAVVGRLDADDPLGAHRLLRRCIEIERVLIQQVTVLETMTPNDFLTFRDHLMPASGFQSAAFRAMEFRCGLKEARHLDNHEAGTPARGELERRISEPTVGDAFYALLRRRGFSLPTADGGGSGEIGGDRGGAGLGSGSDLGSVSRSGDSLREARIRSLLRIYQAPESHYDLYLLAEALVEFDESFSLWRLHHVAMVERMIGSKPGTGGSAGVGYLRTTLGRKFFPELWELRSYLSLKTGP